MAEAWGLQCVLKDKVLSMKLPVVNHPDYVAKINDDNKFPIQKFGALAEHLLNSGVVKSFHIPKECSIETMKTSHSLE